MFYESRSDFFYDPKSKLYYGNKKGCYYKYDSSKSPPFAQFQDVVDKSGPDEGKDPFTMSLEPIADSMGEMKKKSIISIKINSRKVKRHGKAADSESSPFLATKSQKEQVANIEKWAERKTELRRETTNKAETTAIHSKPVNKKVVTTAKGEPICTICKRKFATVEKLRLHETASALHKENLAKLIAAEAAKKRSAPSPTSEYQDRAKKRRELHGPEQIAQNPNVLARVSGPESMEHPSKATEESLGSSNIGNQMLQKLGWKAGSNLGRKGDDQSMETESRPDDATIHKLREDWDRIESLAASRK